MLPKNRRSSLLPQALPSMSCPTLPLCSSTPVPGTVRTASPQTELADPRVGEGARGTTCHGGPTSLSPIHLSPPGGHPISGGGAPRASLGGSCAWLIPCPGRDTSELHSAPDPRAPAAVSRVAALQVCLVAEEERRLWVAPMSPTGSSAHSQGDVLWVTPRLLRMSLLLKHPEVTRGPLSSR